MALSLAAPVQAQNLGDLVSGGIKKAQRKVEDKVVDAVTRPVENAVNGNAASRNRADAAPQENTPLVASGSDSAGATAPDTYLEKSCDGTSAAQLPPTRAAIFSANSPNVSAADTAAERKVIAIIDGILSAWRPNGYTVRPEAEYLNDSQGRVGNADYGNAYNYDLRSDAYACMDGKWNPGTLGNPYGGTMLMVFVNSGMGWGVQGTPQVDFEYYHEEERFGYYTLGGEWIASGRLPEAGDGYYELVYDSEGSTIFWFTRDGRLPFRYVSREAFIRRQIDILQAGKAADEKRLAGAQNARMTELTYDKPMADYRQMLQKPAAWLQQPAICLMGNAGGKRDYARCEFLDAPQPRAQVPVEPEPGYFDRAKPKSAPQYITIDLRANGHPEAAGRQRELIEANADTFLSLIK